MVLQFLIKEIELPEIPARLFGQDRVIRQIIQQLPTILETINKDLLDIVSHGFYVEEAEHLEKLLLLPVKSLFSYTEKLPKTEIKNALEQQIRLFALVIGNRLLQIQNETCRRLFSELIEEIKGAIGCVPGLNDKILLPPKGFLPRDFGSSSKNWQEITFKAPNRSSSENEKLSFFKIARTVNRRKIEIASVRYYLISLESNLNNQHEAISYADADIYAIGDLHADHLQSSEQILERQQELVQAMNIDPLFAQEINKHPESKKYFKKENGITFGTKYFYLTHYNCIDNLWLINAAANTGTGKGNQDPLVWLRNHPRFGEDFFSALGGEQSIDKAKIFYCTSEGKFLAQAAREYFIEKYKTEIAASNYLRAHILKPVKRNLEELAHEEASRKMRHRIIKEMVAMALAKVLISKNEEQTSSGSEKEALNISTPSSAAEMSEENLLLIEQLVQEEEINSNITNRIASNYRQSHKRRRIGAQRHET